jgi:hypothetical protein
MVGSRAAATCRTEEQLVPPRTLETLVGRYPPAVQSLARATRAFLVERLPDLEETVDASAPVIGYGYGTGYKGSICTLLLSKTGVKIGLVGGAALPDPGQLLAGSGKVHRFVPISTASDLRNPSLDRLLAAARAAARERLGM